MTTTRDALSPFREERVSLGDVTLACLVAGRGPVVMCVHGFPDCARSFRAQAPALLAAGYTVLLPTQRGYHPSTESRTDHYDSAALGADLCALADAYSPDAPVRLVGHDWGAVAAFAATARAPARFSHVCTAAVPHFRTSAAFFATPAQLRRSWYMGYFQLPGIAERGLARDGHALIDRFFREWSPSCPADPAEVAHVKAAIAGRERAVLAYYRALRSPAALLGEARRLVFARTTVPAMHVHGVDDGCVGVESTDGMERAYTRGLRLEKIQGAGHFVHQDRPGEFNRALLEFLATDG